MIHYCWVNQDIQKAMDPTLEYCRDSNMSVNIGKTKYMICSIGKMKKTATVFVNGTPFKKFDTFTYL